MCRHTCNLTQFLKKFLNHSTQWPTLPTRKCNNFSNYLKYRATKEDESFIIAFIFYYREKLLFSIKNIQSSKLLMLKQLLLILFKFSFSQNLRFPQIIIVFSKQKPTQTNRKVSLCWQWKLNCNGVCNLC